MVWNHQGQHDQLVPLKRVDIFSHSKEVKRVLHTLQYYVHALNRNFVTFFSITLVRNCDSLLNGSCLLESVIAGVRQMNSRTFYNP